MKPITFLAALLLTFPFSLFTFHCEAQVPQGINYQAVARNSSGNPIINQNSCLKLSIHTGMAGPWSIGKKTAYSPMLSGCSR
jgi:hypothetical protein